MCYIIRNPETSMPKTVRCRDVLLRDIGLGAVFRDDNRPGTAIPGLLQVVHGADAGFSRSERRQLMAAAPLIEPLAQSI